MRTATALAIATASMPAMFEKIRAQRLADAAADAADAERGIKIRRDVRKYGLYKTGKS